MSPTQSAPNTRFAQHKGAGAGRKPQPARPAQLHDGRGTEDLDHDGLEPHWQASIEAATD